MPQILSIQFKDYTGIPMTLPIFFDDGATLDQITAWQAAALPLIDAVVDPVITGTTVTLDVVLPSGLKSSAVTGNTVHEGALLGFSADGTPYRLSDYVPGWQNAGFSANVPLNTGDYATAIAALHGAAGVSSGIQPTDKNGNALTAYISGKRAFRK